MKCIAFAASLSAALMASTVSLAQTPSWAVPPESARCPSKWGVGDERGSGNLMKPQAVLDAITLIKTGEVIDLAHVLGGGMPFFVSQGIGNDLKPTFMNPLSNKTASHAR